MKEENSSFVYALPETFVTPTDEDEKPLTQRVYDLKVAQVWADLKERWDAYGHKLTKLEPVDARRVWTMPLLEALGFEPEALRKQVQVSDRLTFKFSHKGWGINPRYHDPPITHVEPPVQGLDSRLEKGGPSPHDALQQYLNVHDDLWALLTNGLYLRILRDYHHTYVKGYVEFDLEAIFLTRSFRDFQALYRIAHASRFTPSDTGNLYVEEYFQHSQLVGEKVGAKLRENVVRAVIALGNGFLNDQLLAELRADEQKCHEFYEEILRVIYRIIFLLYAEQRGMITSGDRATHPELYLEEYSMSTLRERALTDYRRGDRYTDHWEGLRSTFEMLRRGSPEFGIYPYGGALFDTSSDDHVNRYSCKNSELLEAVYYLTTTEIDGVTHRVSYADLDVVEIGGVYEGLLENIPRITDAPELIINAEYPANSFILDPRALTRKTTGSYYTQQGLIQELIKSALEPVINDRLLDSNDQETQEEALLAIRICDPACGSGAFLIAACNHLGERLALIRSSDAILTEDLLQKARRDVLQHCIYGVDLNPMAVELAKVSLWINALVRDKPLNLLNYHLKCGNSLIGTTQELISEGVPSIAFYPVAGESKERSNEARKSNELQRQNRGLTDWVEAIDIDTCYTEFIKLSELDESDPSVSEEKERKYQRLLQSNLLKERKFSADVWTSAFFWPLNSKSTELPTHGILRNIEDSGSTVVDVAFKDRVEQLRNEFSFFHWHLEFPEVFGKEHSGFDCILGNPPWSKLKINEKDWFRSKSDAIANSSAKSHRTKLINNLQTTDPKLYDLWKKALASSERETAFINRSGRFPLSGRGDVNTYPVFTELSCNELLNSNGAAGLVVKTGLATDYYTRYLFSYLIEQDKLVSLYDFVNSEQIFRDVAPPERFCLVTISGLHKSIQGAEYSFYNTNFEQLKDKDRRYRLSKQDIILINPNTKNCPMFRTITDKDICVKIYKKHPILYDENTGQNTWGIKYSRMFDMANDSALFADNALENLIEQDFDLGADSILRKNKDVYLPLWEGKLFHSYDHRFNTFEGVPAERRFLKKAAALTVSSEQKRDLYYEILPRYWMQKSHFLEEIGKAGWTKKWIFAFRNITNTTTNHKTAIGTILPIFPCSHSSPVLTFKGSNLEVKALLFSAFFSSLTFDFVVRQVIGGPNFTKYLLDQIAVPSPRWIDRFVVSSKDQDISLKDFLVSRALYLTWTSHALDCLGEAFAHTKGPFLWEDSKRAQIRAEIDAVVAKAYGISRDEYSHIIDSFHILRDKEMDTFGDYITKTICMQKFDVINLRSEAT
jgi:hypothetical protein